MDMTKAFLFLAIAATVPLLSVRADDQGPVQKTTNTVKKVAHQTSDAVVNGAKATGRTISNGAKATGTAVSNGTKATERTVGKEFQKAGNTIHNAGSNSKNGQG